MLSFHNDIKVKEKYVNRVKAHAKADNLIQGVGWENGKGCAIGCTLESFDHSAYPTELGLPEWSAKLEDRLFEGMENKYAMKFPLDFLEAIPVGVDLEPVKWKFCSYLCSENLSIVENCDIDKDLKSQVSDSINSSSTFSSRFSSLQKIHRPPIKTIEGSVMPTETDNTELNKPLKGVE